MSSRLHSKILIIGISGTGKSTVSRKIAEITGISVFHMDAIIWRENWVESDATSIERAISDIAARDSWIVEGWIDTYSKPLLSQADLVLDLDYSGIMAMLGGVQRWWKYRGQKRPELPDGCTEAFGLKYLQVMLERRERPHIDKLLSETKPPNVVKCRSRRETERFLRQLTGK